jgi:hypothetical protein
MSARTGRPSPATSAIRPDLRSRRQAFAAAGAPHSSCAGVGAAGRLLTACRCPPGYWAMRPAVAEITGAGREWTVFDDLGGVDALQVHGGDPEFARPSWRSIRTSGTPSCAISTACAWRSWCGANQRRTPASSAVRRSCLRAAEGPSAVRRRTTDHAQQRAGRLYAIRSVGRCRS